MTGAIAVLDLASGKLKDRARETPTLDVPNNFSALSGVVSVDGEALGRYVDVGGNELVYSTFSRPLSWRAHGEQCLVAEARLRTRSSPRRYRISLIKRLRD